MTDEKTPPPDEQIKGLRERVDVIADVLHELKNWVLSVEKRLSALERDLRKRMPMR